MLGFVWKLNNEIVMKIRLTKKYMRNFQRSTFSILTIIPVTSLTKDSSFGKDLAFRVLCFICRLTARSIKFDVLILIQHFLGRERTIKASSTLFLSQRVSTGAISENLSTRSFTALLTWSRFSAS